MTACWHERARVFYPPPSSSTPPMRQLIHFNAKTPNISKPQNIRFKVKALMSNLNFAYKKISYHNNKACFLPWKPREASCCISSETAALSRGSWDCPCARARRRGPPGRPPRSCCPASTSVAPGRPWSRCCLRSYCRGRTSRAAWTVWWWAALREYASQQLGSAPPDWLHGSSWFRWSAAASCLFLCVSLLVSLRWSLLLFLSFLPSSRRGRSRESNNCVRKKDGGEKTAKSTPPPQC